MMSRSSSPPSPPARLLGARAFRVAVVERRLSARRPDRSRCRCAGATFCRCWRWRWRSSRARARRPSSPRRSASWPRAPSSATPSEDALKSPLTLEPLFHVGPVADHRAGRRRLGGHGADRRPRGAVDSPPRRCPVEDPGGARTPRLDHRRPDSRHDAARSGAVSARSSARSSCSSYLELVLARSRASSRRPPISRPMRRWP